MRNLRYFLLADEGSAGLTSHGPKETVNAGQNSCGPLLPGWVFAIPVQYQCLGGMNEVTTQIKKLIVFLFPSSSSIFMPLNRVANHKSFPQLNPAICNKPRHTGCLKDEAKMFFFYVFV